MTARSAGTRPTTLITFNDMYEKTNTSKSYDNLGSATTAYIGALRKEIEKSFTEASITESNPIAGGAAEVGKKQLLDSLERYKQYDELGLIDGAIDRMANHLNNPDDEDILNKLYESWGAVPTPVIPDSPYEKEYFTRAEYRKTFWDNFTVFAVSADFTNQIYYAWQHGEVGIKGDPNLTAVSSGAIPWLINTIQGTAPTLQQRKESMSWIIHFMYYERAIAAVTWYNEEGDGITDVPDAIANRAEYKELLEKQKRDGNLDLDDALKLKQLREAAASGDFTNIGDLDSVEDVSKTLRFTEQTILIRNLKSLAENYTALQKLRNNISEGYEKTYLMYGQPSEMVNKLTLKPGMSTFLDFRTEEISQLAPKFRLYQVLYDTNNIFKAEIEYKFANKNNITGGDLTQAAILESRGREAVGVKSFEWKYIGTNPVTARNDLTAELQIYFQSFDDLFEERPYFDKDGNPDTYRYVDLILRNPIKDGKDLERSCATTADSSPDTEKQKPEKYETKIIVGWNFKGTALENSVRDKNKHISDLSYFNEVLFMTLIDHDFSIEEDGTFTLTITYRARLDALLQDKRSDILATTNIITRRADFERQIKKLEKKCEQSEQTRESLKKLKDEYEERKMKYRQESYQSIVEELSGKGTVASSPRLYHIGIDIAKFVAGGNKLGAKDEYLYDANTSGIQVGSEKITTDLSKNISDPSQVDPTSVSTKQLLANQVSSATESLQTISTTTGIDTPLEIAGAVPLIATPIGVASNAYVVYQSGKQLYSDYETNSIISEFQDTGNIDPEDINKFLRTTVDIVDGVYNIHYFFLGDLVELLAQRVLNENRQKTISDTDANLATEQLDNIRIILGTMEWFPRAEGATQDPYRVNIGALPVSLMIFNNFMLRRVLAKKRDIYSLLDFIIDFLRYMLVEVLGANSEESDSSLKLNIDVKSTVLTMPGRPAGVDASQTLDPIAAKIQEDQQGGITLSPEALAGGSVAGLTLNLDKINEENTIVPYTNPESNSANRGYHYLTIYVENKTPSHLRGHEDADRNAGIYHFHIGKSRSIFKRANFKKTNATYLREARFVNESYNPLATLANVYDVDMEMFGNTIFYPGQYLFINPFGLGKSIGLPWDCSSFSNIMGLGGYHLVTEVSSVMDEDGFSTNVKARYETSGDGKSKSDSRTDSQSPNCPTPEATEIK